MNTTDYIKIKKKGFKLQQKKRSVEFGHCYMIFIFTKRGEFLGTGVKIVTVKIQRVETELC